ncbi:MAG TPA: HEAT repeat domain-containing protein [Vicinamibacterales bacterium]|nr:HEAT repeat domain-containing protein [Vicinamibacterales bacterium]
MGKFTVLLLALVAGLGAAVWYYRHEPDATRRSAIVRVDDSWLDDLFSRNPREVTSATEQLEAEGAAAVPIIRKVLQDRSETVERRKSALKACAILGPTAAPAVPDAAALLDEPEYTAEAALALSFMGPSAAPSLRAGTRAADPAVRRESLRSLGKLRERRAIGSDEVLTALFDGLTDDDATVRGVAATYLGIIVDDPSRAVAELADALEDEDASVRRSAASALAAYGPQAEPAIPALRKAVRDPDEEVRREAGRTLVRIAELK